jgi:hypothetical protein
VHDIDGFRNNAIYLNLMKRINIDGKVQKYDEWLNKIRVEEFIRKETNLLLHYKDQSKCLQKIQTRYQEWRLQIGRSLEGPRRVIENIHIASRRLKEPNLWLLRSLSINNKIIQKSIQAATDILTKLANDSIFEDKGQQLLIFLSGELFDPKNSSVSNNE